ncbi:peptidoglycan-binding domain-containing protein [Aquibaculum arenosum]|uniref:Peptidoglycan-binding domain-containing protein n=1 Tax=Aquibaculum arenosum TaxID=3032591 RepID=A0ABT5YRK2_9PROT|nr:peptidoglycan-binding protein [Fodinicurvata sp. CAU 1616]MDF2097375.1 peptidoglycan-binding domain-containing protein [Fodinicurvata sp. CAU 1616]
MIHMRHPTALAALLLATTAMPGVAFATIEGAEPRAWAAADRSAVGAQSASGEIGLIQLAQSRNVLDIQARLNRLGYQAGPEDGMMGSQTRRAIEAYQSDEGLLVTGEPSQSLLNHIEESVEQRFGRAEQPEADTRAQEAGEEATDDQADMIAAIQSELRQRDYRMPTVSGEMNDATREAIRAYERDRGYLVTGRATPELLEDLRADSNRSDRDNLTSSNIAAIQQGLNERGYQAGPADGVIGPATRTAIRTYQSDAGMDPTGRVSAELLSRLQGDRADDEDGAEANDDRDAGAFVTLLSDDFDDGDYTSNPGWRIASGEFSVRNGGLTSRMDPPRRDTVEGVGLQLLGSVLERELGIRLPSQGGVATAHTAVAIPETFRISAELSGRDLTRGQVNIGPYRGNQLGHGYRLAYLDNNAESLALLRMTGDDQVVLDSTSLSLANDQTVSLDWERREDGAMTVALNGNVVLQANDTAFSGGFDGFSLINAGGEWTLHSVAIESRE